MSEEKFQAELLRRLQSGERIQEKVWKAINEVNNKQTLLTDYQARANGTLKDHGKRIRIIEDVCLAKKATCEQYHEKIDNVNEHYVDLKAANKFVNKAIAKMVAVISILGGIFAIIIYII